MSPWLDVVGIGDDGLPGLSPPSRAIVDAAEVLIGGERHLAMLPPDGRERLAWPSPFDAMTTTLRELRGRKVCVLATGDPCCHGVGSLLVQDFGSAAVRIWPAPSAFSLACARMGWSQSEVETLSLHGRPLERLAAVLQPAAQVLALSADGSTPARVAALLRARGYGPSHMTVLCHLGGPLEGAIESAAEHWNPQTTVPDLNTIAIECWPAAGTLLLPRTPGLPDDAFGHDGQITKRDVRAITVAALGPVPGQLLWDVGAGSGSIAIEWLRHHPRCRATAVEQHPERAANIADNARALGVPELQIVRGTAPQALAALHAPDAVFIGGGVTEEGVGEACWSALAGGGRLVANTVTLEGAQTVARWQSQWGGELLQIAISRGQPLGRFRSFQPLAPVTQYRATKPGIEHA